MQVHSLAAQLGSSPRHLSRAFNAAFGIGPKRFARLARFQKILAERRTGRSWAQVAQACWLDRSSSPRQRIPGHRWQVAERFLHPRTSHRRSRDGRSQPHNPARPPNGSLGHEKLNRTSENAKTNCAEIAKLMPRILVDFRRQHDEYDRESCHSNGGVSGNRYGIVRQFLAKGYRVVACSREIATTGQPIWSRLPAISHSRKWPRWSSKRRKSTSDAWTP